ncbi:hemin ABC transporter substrate-binding protein [Nocardiopsis sp. NRRL B-16309]|uniref:heme/hemin ABC transporter substrate-binding protein n=1 Tax=Nocardiopsis sp. NRRL B-16309 TaxID=1519494 RepID=UPI0006AF6E96|nr:ABC transporter substrate-binding protein [Nocardiopsis sp. NRRL B-16309]KOX13598.1 ABC transporter permease [Nocardiopsis sp. NRRL B-16309]
MPHDDPRPRLRRPGGPGRPTRASTTRPRTRSAAAALALAFALTACGTSGLEPPDTASGGAGDIPDLAENRLQILEDPGEPSLPVTVSSVVHDPYRTSDDPLEYEDVEVTDTSRILPLTGSLSEIVFTLGLGDHVVGRDTAATFAEAADLPVVSEAHEVSAESVLSLEPTVILADTQTGPPEAIEQLRASGVPVVIIEEAWSIEEMYPRFTRVAEALGVPEAGERLVERTREQMAEVRAASAEAAGDPLVAFLYLRGSAGVYLLGGPGSGADALLAEVGARDAGVEAGLTAPFTPITSEALIAAQPEVILVMTKGLESVGGVEGLVEIPGIAQTPAGATGTVIDFEDGVLLNFGPRTPQVVAALAGELAGLETAGAAE